LNMFMCVFTLPLNIYWVNGTIFWNPAWTSWNWRPSKFLFYFPYYK
jgi:hypothetical protein